MKIYFPLNTEPKPTLQEIEVATSFQLPCFQIIGLPAPEVSEAKERIRSAIEASGLTFPKKKIILNLSPAHIQKRGPGLDLPMALAILSNSESPTFFSTQFSEYAAWGDLGLNGSIKPSYQLTRSIFSVWQAKIKFFFISACEYSQAEKALDEIQKSRIFQKKLPPLLIPVSHLKEAWEIIAFNKFNRKKKTGKSTPLPQKEPLLTPTPPKSHRHQLLPLPPAIERMIGVAVTGQHHLLLMGPKGTGKSHALEWFIALQPDSSPEEKLKRKLISELIPSRSCIYQESPIRRISSQVRPETLIGTVLQSQLRPGEFSLAHGGLLIADELLEWPKNSIEILREPLERGKISLTRSRLSIELPAEFVLVATSNLCPCGGQPSFLGASQNNTLIHSCQCTPRAQHSYRQRLSGPILDRIDMISFFLESNTTNVCADSQFKKLQQNIMRSQIFLKNRFKKLPGHLKSVELESILEKNPKWNDLLLSLKLPHSIRSKNKILKIALTLAAWDNIEEPSLTHFIEASLYRKETII